MIGPKKARQGERIGSKEDFRMCLLIFKDGFPKLSSLTINVHTVGPTSITMSSLPWDVTYLTTL